MLQSHQTARNQRGRIPFTMAEAYDFTTDIRRVLRRARDNAIEHGDRAVEPAHLLYGLASLPTSRATNVLIALGANLADLQLLAGGPVDHEAESPPTRRETMLARLKSLKRPTPQLAPTPPKEIGYSPRATRALQLTLDEFQHRGDPDCDTDHLLLGILALRDDQAVALLLSAGVDLERARHEVARERERARPRS
jgi:ATP-dependent Clp protease ATP-binding subunit ClpA